MAARNEKTDRNETESAVERSLDDFIARANTTLPPATDTQATAVRALGGRRKKARPPSTLVVLGSEKPLAEETELVSRLPAELLEERPARSWFSLRLGLAFLAGAAAVLILTRLIAGPPEPVQPMATPVAPAPAVAPEPPPIVVEPMPVATPAPEAEPAPAVEPAAVPVRKKPARVAAPPRAAPAPREKKPSGLVDPFAD